MRGPFSYNNPIFITLLQFINMVILSVMWAVFCIPVVTAGASTAALYYSVQKWKYERGCAWECFMESFKENFKQSVVGELICFAVVFVAVTDLSVVGWLQGAGMSQGVLKPFFVVLIVMACVYAFWYFASLARFHNTLKNQLKNAAALMFVHWPVSLFIALVGGAAALLLYLAPYFIFMVPALAVWLVSLMTEKVFRRYMTEEDRQLEDELNMVYRKKEEKN